MARIQERWIGYCLGKSVSVDTSPGILFCMYTAICCATVMLFKSQFSTDEVQQESVIHINFR